MTDDHDFDSLGELDIEIARYALRTFRVEDGKLSSVVVGAGHWENGVCIAVCTRNPEDPTHEAPAKGCSCGIYATHSVAALFRQYGKQACRIVTVIAPEGRTVTGDTGLRTSAARIVAYWCGEGSPSEADVCAQIPNLPDGRRLRRYYNVDVMARMYGLGEANS
jgi:hypothetical protein